MSKDTLTFFVEVNFDYTVQPLDDDPDDIWEFSDQERDALRREVARIHGIEEGSVRVKVSPSAADVKNWAAG